MEVVVRNTMPILINTNSQLDLLIFLLVPGTSHMTFVRQQRRLHDLPIYHPSRGLASLAASIAQQRIGCTESSLRQVFQVRQILVPARSPFVQPQMLEADETDRDSVRSVFDALGVALGKLDAGNRGGDYTLSGTRERVNTRRRNVSPGNSGRTT
jgi:hypothetical protein